MNSLYTLIHTVVVFLAGSGSILATNANAAFAVDLGIMGVTATVIYSYLFQKTKYNVLYVLLIGTVLTSFFGSIQSTLTRTPTSTIPCSTLWWPASATSTGRSSYLP